MTVTFFPQTQFDIYVHVRYNLLTRCINVKQKDLILGFCTALQILQTKGGFFMRLIKVKFSGSFAKENNYTTTIFENQQRR